MFEQSRRTFLRLGALAAAGPLVGKCIPVSALEAFEQASENAFVTIRARLTPCAWSGVTFAEHARLVSLAWAQPRQSLLPRARVAAHDVFREVMEEVPTTAEIAVRARQSSKLAWYLQLVYVTWAGGAADVERLANAERAVFASMNADNPLKGDVYNTVLRERLTGVSRQIGIPVTARFPCVFRLDHPKSWLWSSTLPGANDPAVFGEVAAAHLSSAFLPRFEALLGNPYHWTRRAHLAAAMARLQRGRFRASA
jgi:hypothetical protein